MLDRLTSWSIALLLVSSSAFLACGDDVQREDASVSPDAAPDAGLPDAFAPDAAEPDASAPDATTATTTVYLEHGNNWPAVGASESADRRMRGRVFGGPVESAENALYRIRGTFVPLSR